ncbi:MAG: M20/M25/M40 family metallo-hydrolase [Candidatus Helarchaeota archaeon]
MSVNEKNAYEITRKLSFPRATGSEGEEKAKKIVIEEFEKIGYKPIKEEFKTSYFNWVFARIIFIPIALIILLMAIFMYIEPWISLIFVAGILTIGLVALRLINGSKIVNKGRIYTTHNIYSKLESPNSKGKIVFMGHWDTKSQTFSSIIRILILVIVLFGGLILTGIYFLLCILVIFFNIQIDDLILHIFLGLSIAIIIPAILNCFNKTENKSPGALDNAASVGTVLELARIFKENPLNNYDLIFLIPGSEELNLGGAIAFIDRHLNEFDPKNTYFINFDGVGSKNAIRLITSYGVPKKNASKKLNDLFMKKAKENNIKINNIWLPFGAWSDYMIAVNRGFEACWLGSDGIIQYVHTPKDSFEKVSEKGLKDAILLTYNVVMELEKEKA